MEQRLLLQEKQQEQETESIRDLQVRLKFLKGEKEFLQKELKEKQQEWATAECSMKGQLEEQCRLLQEKQQERETESIQDLQVRLKFLKGEKESLQKELEAKTLAARSARASQRAQLEKHRAETKRIGAILRKAEALETKHSRLLEGKKSLVEEMEKSRASYEAEISSLKQENNQLAAAVKDAERQMRTKHLQWLNEKLSLLEKLERSQNSIHNLQLKFQEEKEALQIVEKQHHCLLQQKQQEWESTECCLKGELEEMKGKLEEIKNQLSQKTKKKKWYRRLI
uniref:kinesin-like protein KIF15 n=1 Tax=Monopterus albus TaxID=43700 RepID=UPI0009B346C8|nr:kinesin-like protein KIF15 [Monopterus albus]